ncbi:class I SAM-dependent methyltransferase [Demequina muriae]|uniref:Class I SAM-dependent methyltransferase n=1 Tax=Demequina muriae TaxID=3051664 RepID=A0ABT8GH62_9MICO|nr:class I SAM-dependent methyltransferase [Demequina sp. EGI L300058]MDN4480757.1 class I SAM-dependent methyltransferase [Demequina sp. EGI L300058]
MSTQTENHSSGESTRDVERDAWDARYRSRERVWTGHPNAPLIDEVEHIVTPGTALDVGCGEGADAVWLARQGWLVTAVDLSLTAIGRAREHAETAGVGHHVTFTDEDLETLVDTRGPWNLVTSLYTHSMHGGRWLVETLAGAVAPGGMLLVIGHHPTDPHASEHPDLRDKTFAAEDVAAVLDRSLWEVSATLRERTTREPDGRERLWRDAVLVARRHD